VIPSLSKVKTVSALSAKLNSLKSRGSKVVFTNGCFDILHVGHVDYLEKAKRQGNILVVGLNSDSSVKKIKGSARPINRQRDRARVLAALSCVDYITIFSEDTPERLIKKLKPDIIVKGGDWKKKDIVGGSFVESLGGKVVTIPFVPGYSTTSLIKKICA